MAIIYYIHVLWPHLNYCRVGHLGIISYTSLTTGIIMFLMIKTSISSYYILTAKAAVKLGCVRTAKKKEASKRCAGGLVLSCIVEGRGISAASYDTATTSPFHGM